MVFIYIVIITPQTFPIIIIYVHPEIAEERDDNGVDDGERCAGEECRGCLSGSGGGGGDGGVRRGGGDEGGDVDHAVGVDRVHPDGDR